MPEKTELAVQEAVPIEVLRPVGSVQQIALAWDMFQELKRALIKEDDYYTDDRGKRQLRIAGWRKFAIAYGLTTELMAEDYMHDKVEPREWVARVVLRVQARGGRSATGIGYFSTREVKHKYLEDNSIVHPTKTDKSGAPIPVPLEHLTTSRAYTRALKRAIQDMIGPVEQDEDDEEDLMPPAPKAPPPTPPRPPLPHAGEQLRVDSSRRAVVVRFLEDVLGDDIMDLVRLQEQEGELLVVLPAPIPEGIRTRFIKGMMQIGQGISESKDGLVARMRAPKS